MNLHLESLPHQRDALDALMRSMPELSQVAGGKDNPCANPLLQNGGRDKSFIDIKMETGTGKTYVYTRAMYELHKKFGLFKFIILVPSLAIKEGTKNFIDSDYARQHFSQFFQNKRVDLQIINSGDFSGKKGRKNIPTGLMRFCMAAKSDKNTIQCLLLSDTGFLDRAKSSLFNEDYDRTIISSFNCPADAIAEIKPIVIIDEPHRFKRTGKSYTNLMARFKPQMVLRFGATFPKEKGKADYYRGAPQFDLNAVEAFNQDLVKGIKIHYPSVPEDKAKTYIVANVTNKELCLRSDGKDWYFDKGDSLSKIGFEGNICFEGGWKDRRPHLSNELELEKGMKLVEGVFSNSYQELLLDSALDSHFSIEEKNFHRQENNEGLRVKTNALFFIDSIESYRSPEGWLKKTFERLLRQKIDNLLKKYTEGAYHDFLSATKRDMHLAHGGYFAEDWGKTDSHGGLADEREDILHKERSLAFKKADKSWNIRRFFFSKWTLREGWDNPNVFTICKLRSSGSETSKLQEVGRGLRLPVDERGNRLSGSEWYLHYHIGWDEKNFAEQLKEQVNGDSKPVLNEKELTEKMIESICFSYEIDKMTLLQQLDADGIIDRSNAFRAGGFEKLLGLYPMLQCPLKDQKILDNKEKPLKVKLRRENWEKIRTLWLAISKRYMLKLESLPGGSASIKSLFAEVLNDENALRDYTKIEIIETLQKGNDEIDFTYASPQLSSNIQIGFMPYNEFAKKLAYRTSVPIQIIHHALWERLKELSGQQETKQKINAKLNEVSLRKITELWKEKFAEKYATLYQYDKLDFAAKSTVFENGDFKKEISSGLLGRYISKGISDNDDKYNLYERPFYNDSDIEYQIERLGKGSKKIVVFGKLPKKSIRVPVYTGGTTSPDFIYAAHDKDDNISLALLVEAKPPAEKMRPTEKWAVRAQEKYFKFIGPSLKWKVITNAQDIFAELEKL